MLVCASLKTFDSFFFYKKEQYGTKNTKLLYIDIAWCHCKLDSIATCIKKVLWLHAVADFSAMLLCQKKEMNTDELTFILRFIVCQTNLEPSPSFMCAM